MTNEQMACVYDDLAEVNAVLGHMDLAYHCERQAAALRAGGELVWWEDDDDAAA